MRTLDRQISQFVADAVDTNAFPEVVDDLIGTVQVLHTVGTNHALLDVLIDVMIDALSPWSNANLHQIAKRK